MGIKKAISKVYEEEDANPFVFRAIVYSRDQPLRRVSFDFRAKVSTRRDAVGESISYTNDSDRGGFNWAGSVLSAWLVNYLYIIEGT